MRQNPNPNLNPKHHPNLPWGRLLMIALIFLVFVIFSTGCASNKDKGYTIPDKVFITVDERLLEDCKDLPILAGPTDEEIGAWAKELIEIQVDCRKRKAKETAILRQLLNQPDTRLKSVKK